METNKGLRTASAGDAAVEGLLNGILAGIVMALFFVVVEVVSGSAPLAALGYFDVSQIGSPLNGLFVHFAVAGVYGLLFGLGWSALKRSVNFQLNPLGALGIGVVYGLLILVVAEIVILPRTSSPLRDLPLWAFGAAHLVYGIVLAELMRR